MSIKAMKLALEALDIAQAMLADLKSYHQPKMLQAYTALRQALEQVKQRQDGDCSFCTNGCKACDAKYIYGWPLGKDPREMTDAELKSAHGITGEQK